MLRKNSSAGPSIILCSLILILSQVRESYGQESLKRPPRDAGVSEKIDFYLGFLGDSSYVRIMEHGGAEIPYYEAAEQLGNIGLRAVPPLMEILNKTGDTFERKMAFYALRLAVQNENVRNLIGRTTPYDPPGTFNRAYPPLKYHNILLKSWNRWWNRYGERIKSHIGKMESKE